MMMTSCRVRPELTAASPRLCSLSSRRRTKMRRPQPRVWARLQKRSGRGSSRKQVRLCHCHFEADSSIGLSLNRMQSF